MNIEKYTERARGFLQAAQTIALREGHQQFAPEHVLKAPARRFRGHGRGGLIARAGGDAKKPRSSSPTQALAKLPKVEGGSGQLYLQPGTARVFDAAEKAADKAGDSFVTVERLLLALVIEKDTEAGKALAKAGLSAQNLNAAINALRQGPYRRQRLGGERLRGLEEIRPAISPRRRATASSIR